MPKEKRPPGRPKKKHPGGRPSIMTPETLQKLEKAFLMGCSDLEACLFADIKSPQTLYNYQKENPEFLERKQLLKENPCMIARKTVLKGLEDDNKLAFDYLKAKKNKEFMEKKGLEVGGDPDKPLKWVVEVVKPKEEE